MPTDSEPLHCYSQLHATVTRMLDLARARQWGELPALDAECARLVERLRLLGEPRALSDQERSIIAGMIGGIGRVQQELAALIQPQLVRLVHRIDVLQRRKQLDAVYGSR